MKLAINLISTLIFILSPFVLAKQRITSNSVQEFSALIKKKTTEIGAGKILVVYDFDNTLMAMNRDIGSDQWYNWQADLIKAGKSSEAVAKTMGELFDIHAIIFSLGRMRPVEPVTATVVKDLQKLGVDTLILTSRGANLRGDTEEELGRIQLSFRSSAPGPEGGFPGSFLLDELDRKISYMDGIAMGSGQHKGKILATLLKKLKVEYSTIFFIDDTLKNIENMEETFASEKPELISFYYTFEHERVRLFKKDKSQAKRDWKMLEPVLRELAEM